MLINSIVEINPTLSAQAEIIKEETQRIQDLESRQAIQLRTHLRTQLRLRKGSTTAKQREALLLTALQKLARLV